MAWDPELYNKFRNERYQPFYDLLPLIKKKDGLSVVDLGCGTGELTRKLADYLPGSQVLGIDSSKEMLSAALAYESEHVIFRQTGIEEFIKDAPKFDLVFSNAALQWVDDHEKLIPAVASLVKTGGQLVVQVPSNHYHFTHRTLSQIASEEPYHSALQGWYRPHSVLEIDAYAKMFFDMGCSEMTVFEKVYPHVLQDATAVFEMTSGTGLIRYLDRLPENLKASYTQVYKERLNAAYGNDRPVFYPFKLILMSALF